MFIIRVGYWKNRSLILSRATMLAENLALRQQLLVFQRRIKRPKLHRSDRRLWVGLYPNNGLG